MSFAYPVTILRAPDNTVVGYNFPDFNFQHNIDPSTSREEQKDVKSALIAHIQYLAANKAAIPFPGNLMDYKEQCSIGENDHWDICLIDPFFAGPIEKYLPSIGMIASITAAITMGILDFYIARQAADSNGGTFFAAIGAILAAIMAVIVYRYSEASHTASKIGRSIDNIKARGVNHFFHRVRNTSRADVAKLLLTFIPLFTIAFSLYGHFKRVANSIQENNQNTELFFQAISVVMIICTAMSLLIFKLSFMPKLYDQIENHLGQQLSRGRYHALEQSVVALEEVLTMDNEQGEPQQQQRAEQQAPSQAAHSA